MHFAVKIILLFVIYLTAGACNNQTSTTDKHNGKSADPPAHSSLLSTGLDAEPKFSKADSLQVLYFDEPYGDSLRYTRYFSYVSVDDSAVIKTIIKEFDTLYNQTNEVKKQCRSEGKIIVYAGPDPVKTLYFTTGNIDKCTPYIYFIKDGAFYYFGLSQQSVNILNELKKKSRKP
jgi:hypothetical protein